MSKIVKLKLDAAMVKERMRATGLRSRDVEEKSDGQITARQLKYYVNQNGPADEDTIRLLAKILQCDENDIIDKDELLSENIPGDINIMLARLYERKKEDIQVIYKDILTDVMTKCEVKKLLQIAHRLFMVFADEDIDFDRKLIVAAVDIVTSTLTESTRICNQRFKELPKEFSERLMELIGEKNDGHYHPQMTVLIFLYVNVIFEAVFLAEMVCSAAEIMPQRANDKAQQYFVLAALSEKIRFTLIEEIFYRGYMLEDNKAEELRIPDLVIKGIVLMLAACEKCRKHAEGEYVASEYVNRATFNAVLNKLTKILSDISIELPLPTALDTFGSLFSKKYLELKILFNSRNPPKRPRNYHDGYHDGEITGFFMGKYFR